MNDEWISIEEHGLPEPGVYIFQSSEGERLFAKVEECDGHRYYTHAIKNKFSFGETTHYLKEHKMNEINTALVQDGIKLIEDAIQRFSSTEHPEIPKILGALSMILQFAKAL